MDYRIVPENFSNSWTHTHTKQKQIIHDINYNFMRTIYRLNCIHQWVEFIFIAFAKCECRCCRRLRRRTGSTFIYKSKIGRL